jgi:hypothetical protein
MSLERWMMRFLRKRGWVVFYLDEPARKCFSGHCWLKLYESERLKDEIEELKKELPPHLRHL